MTTPTHAAHLATARDRVAEILDALPNPQHTARLVIDQLLDLGWTAPGRHLEPVPQPSTSSAAVREKARRELAEAIRAGKERRGEEYGR